MSTTEEFSVIVIDDEIDIAEILSESLGYDGFRSTFETDPQKAIVQLKEQRIDVVLCDANMPGMKGLEVLKFITTLEHKPLYYLCTGDLDANEDEIIGLGGTGLIMKPFSVSDVIDRIKKDLRIS
ncbi:MAG: hypothetical protein COW00_04150 [Bdellovibrio sp. CG12_big_fil_rev_8_21_14_0_65_39_13]|nr:MAG: hypothetical protein COW78_20280 [Bdellovibrio sp. CG22_combo_CG10-13_8_21_14_all_39_27]PIQ61305.1 MAG: hypothetical protein COW00_04150 [Bdellovibrio sp. CG12_big_fil_rev_8_21_14_0_65_39_13]PIR33614.1 MAG: hypothetical protein COV37_15795 [Bdellovibrio sp. CG11_big_fil_rev_8_21_14_0_20_39_38]PJB52579.1 MAG: hypothetical protein CO099_11860 [Bdellovibrio sp. CG_4_9_14_3_um_filter_39_7]